MKSLKSAFKYLLVFAIVIGAVVFVITNWSWVFAKRVSGEIMEVERVTAPTAVFGRATDVQMHSYSVLIKADNGELYSASSEDRQWAVAKKGYCVEALFYRYPPWKFDEGNTFFNARVEQLKLCPGKAPAPPEPVAPAEGTTGEVPPAPPEGQEQPPGQQAPPAPQPTQTPTQPGIVGGGTVTFGAAQPVNIDEHAAKPAATPAPPAKRVAPPPPRSGAKKTQPVERPTK
jgi:hypothetical protein